MCSLTFTLPRVPRERAASNCDRSVHFHSRAHKSGARETGGKKESGRKKQPCITADRSLEPCNAASECFKD